MYGPDELFNAMNPRGNGLGIDGRGHLRGKQTMTWILTTIGRFCPDVYRMGNSSRKTNPSFNVSTRPWPEWILHADEAEKTI